MKKKIEPDHPIFTKPIFIKEHKTGRGTEKGKEIKKKTKNKADRGTEKRKEKRNFFKKKTKNRADRALSEMAHPTKPPQKSFPWQPSCVWLPIK